MAVRIRLLRLGCTNRPFYRVVAADSKATRDGRHLEVLGYYNPIAGHDDEKRVSLKLERLKYWLSVGAQPTDTVEDLLFRAGLLPPQPVLSPARKGGPLDTHSVGDINGHVLNQDKPANANHNEDDGISPESIFSIGLQVN